MRIVQSIKFCEPINVCFGRMDLFLNAPPQKVLRSANGSIQL